VRARRRGARVQVSVAPEAVPVGDLLVSPGCDGVLVLETDLMREVAVWEGSGGVDQTAYALLSDLVAIARWRPRSRRRDLG
jgi:homoserine dehydrogenase